MTLAAKIKKLFDAKRITYRELAHTRTNYLRQAATYLNLDITNIVTAELVEDHAGKLLLVYPVNKKVDLLKVNKILHRQLTPLAEQQVNRIFNDCDAGCWPPIGRAYGLDVVLDKSIESKNIIFFSSGSATALVQMRMVDFLFLNSRARTINFVSDEVTQNNLYIEPVEVSLDAVLMPKLPTTALKILHLIANSATAINSANVAEILRNAIGFDMVSHVGLNKDPQPEINNFWQHAFYAASYAESITGLVDNKYALDPAVSYLAGLFHNFGLLLFSQLYPPEYSLLEKWMRLNPKVSIAVLENKLLGMGQAFSVVRAGHAQLGEKLMRHWKMPQAVCVVAKEHHSLMYKGEYAHYVKIIQITNQLLREQNIGDGSLSGLSKQLLEPLELTEEQIRGSLQNLQTVSPELDKMVKSLSDR